MQTVSALLFLRFLYVITLVFRLMTNVCSHVDAWWYVYFFAVGVRNYKDYQLVDAWEMW